MSVEILSTYDYSLVTCWISDSEQWPNFILNRLYSIFSHKLASYCDTYLGTPHLPIYSTYSLFSIFVQCSPNPHMKISSPHPQSPKKESEIRNSPQCFLVHPNIAPYSMQLSALFMFGGTSTLSWIPLYIQISSIQTSLEFFKNKFMQNCFITFF